MDDYNKIAEELSGIDVAMLIPNAGQGFIGEFKNMDDEYL
jgi:short-subunit dehydrogenase